MHWVCKLVFVVVVVTLFSVGIFFAHLSWPWISLRPTALQSNQTCDFVVSAYKEDLDWLQQLPSAWRVVIYSKHEATKQNAISLPNKGRCDHTYVHHILANYTRLPNVTIFATGSTFTISRKHFMLKHIIEPRLGANFRCIGDTKWVNPDFCLDEWQSTARENRHANSQLVLARVRPFKNWWHARFETQSLPYYAVYGGVFAVSKEAIQSVPISVWQMLLEELSDGENVEVGHYMERAWFHLFTACHF
jgi:hypothetical protein